MTTDRDPRDVARIARSLGCTVLDQIAGGLGRSTRIDCPTTQHKVDLLVALGRYDAERFPDVVRLARTVIARAGDGCHGRVSAIQRFVHGTIGFADEPGEIFPSAMTVLVDGIGDCDDHAILVVALATAVGIEASAEAFFWPSGEGHVAALCQCGDEWLWCETTIPAHVGEHPIDAARRQGIKTRGDIHG